MAVSFNRLWKLLIDLSKTKKELAAEASVSPATLTRMKKGESISTDVLERICRALNCEIQDIMEFVPNNIDDNKLDDEADAILK